MNVNSFLDIVRNKYIRAVEKYMKLADKKYKKNKKLLDSGDKEYRDDDNDKKGLHVDKPL